MKILHLESSPGWGGQEMRILKESLGMQKRGHEIIMAVIKGGLLIEEARKSGFKVYEVDFRRRFWLFSFFKIAYIIFKHGIDLLNTHSSKDAWLGGFAARLLGKKVIRTRHLSTEVRGGLNSLFLYNFLADFVVTTCSDIIPKLSLKAKKDRACFLSVPTGVEEFEVKGTFRKEMGYLESDFLVGTVCFMRSWKGIEDFLKAALSLKDENIKWLIVGGGHAAAYMDMAKKMGLEVKFTGHLEKPYEAIYALDIFLLLSTAHEGVSQASLQAAYLKKPIIATPTGGLKEVCLDGETGISVPPFSFEIVKEAVLRLKKDSDLRLRMGEKAKKLVEQKFTKKVMLDEMEAVYKKVMYEKCY